MIFYSMTEVGIIPQSVKKINTRKAWGQQWLSDKELFFQVFCSVDNSIETWISFTFIMRWPPLRQSLHGDIYQQVNRFIY